MPSDGKPGFFCPACNMWFFPETDHGRARLEEAMARPHLGLLFQHQAKDGTTHEMEPRVFRSS